MLTLKTRIGYICNIRGYQRAICDGLEMKLTYPLGRIQQAGAPKKQLRKAFLQLFLLAVIDYDYKRSDTSLYSTRS